MVFGLFSKRSSSTSPTPGSSRSSISQPLFMRPFLNIFAWMFSADSDIEEARIRHLVQESRDWQLKCHEANSRWEQDRVFYMTLMNQFVQYVSWYHKQWEDIVIRVKALASENASLPLERKKLGELQAAYNAVVQGTEDLSKENGKFEKKIAALNLNLDAVAQSIKSLEKELREKEESLREVKMQRDNLREAHDALKSEFRALQQENTGLKALVNGEVGDGELVTPTSSKMEFGNRLPSR